jgi:hypothetical protein
MMLIFYVPESSVADPGCLSRIPDPGSRIPDPKTATKERGEKNLLSCSHKFHKIANYFSFEALKKKISANFQRIIELFTQKIVNKLSKIWVWDPGSGKNLFWIPDPGSRGQKGTGSWIPDPDPQHCLRAILCTFQISVDFYERGAGGHWLRSLPFQGPKKSRFLGPPPP